MDLSSRDSYRGQPALCPTCGTLMDEIDVGSALVDVCRGCRGLWLDWFDGDPRHLTVQTEATLLEARPSLATAERTTLESSGTVATPHGCARCRERLMREDFEIRPAILADADADPPVAAEPAGYIEVFRCGGCFGLFLTRACAESVVALDLDEAPRSLSGSLEPLPWQKLLSIVKRILGLG